MSAKIIISEKIVGPDFIDVVLDHVIYLGKKNNINIDDIQNQLNKSKTPEDFVNIIHSYFSNELKLIP